MTYSDRKGCQVSWAALILLCFLVAMTSLAHASAANQPRHIVLSWSEHPETTQTITWQTQAESFDTTVQFREAAKAGDGWQEAARESVSTVFFANNVDNRYVHRTVLQNLKPDCTYLYRVGSSDQWSETSSFTTAPAIKKPFSFLLFGDSQSFDYSIWRKTLLTAWAHQPQAAFFINVGDLVDTGQDIREWDAWFDGAKGVIDRIPAMPVTGNHEMYTVERRFSRPIYFTTQLSLPQNGPEEMKGQVYSFDYSNVHFVMLDSQFGEERSLIPAMPELEKQWLEQDLAASKQPWKVVVLHKPPYNNKNSESTEALRRAFVPLFEKYQVDVVFSGHDHVYARTYPLVGGKFVSETQQGTIFVASGRSGTKTYHTTVAKEWNTFFHNPVDEPNYLTIHVDGSHLTIQAMTVSGVLLDSFSITKAVP